MTDYMRYDFRKDSLYTVLHGLERSKTIVEEKLKLNDWYDGIFAREELEPIIGIAFIACQNYINKSIADIQISYFQSFKKFEFYKMYRNLNDFECTAIQMIVALANYSKHEQDNKLEPHTTKILDVFNLNYLNPDIVDSSPIFTGVELISEDWNLIALGDIVADWREELWRKII